MTIRPDSISFAPVTSTDLELLRGWLDTPHLREWWGDPETELGFIRDMVEGRDTTRPFIFHIDGEPAGYIQYWFVDHWQNEPWVSENPWLRLLPPGAIGVDLSIGDARRLSQGLGSTVLRLFTERLAAEGYTCIIIDPDPANRRAVSAYEKAGFRVIPELLGRSGNSLIMKFDPELREHQ